MKLFTHLRSVVILSVIFTLSSCHQVQDIPLPEEIAEYPQPESFPLELTDPQPLHWDTIGKSSLKPTVFSLDFNQLKSKPFDPDGFKPAPSEPTITAFDFDNLPVTDFTPEKNEEQPLKMSVNVLPATFPSIKLSKTERVDASTMDIHVWKQLSDMNIQVYALAKDSSGLLWIGGTKLLRFDGTKLEVVLSDLAIVNMFVDGEGNLWIANWPTNDFEIKKLDLAHNVLYTFSMGLQPSQIAGKIHQDADGNVWYATRTAPGSIVKLMPAKKSYIVYDEKAGFTSSRYYNVTSDKDGLLWINSRDGIAILNPKTKKIKHLDSKAGLLGDTVSMTIPGPDGRMWIYSLGKLSNDIEAIDIANRQIIHYPLFTSREMFPFFWKMTSNGNWIIGMSGGFMMWRPEDNTVRYINSGKDVPLVHGFDLIEYGDVLYAVTINDNLSLSSLSEIRQDATTVFPFANTIIVSAEEDSKRNLWVGAEEALYVVDSERKIYWQLDSAHGLASSSIQNVSESDGEIFITSNGGYNVYNPKENTLSRISRKEGLAADTVFNIVIDNKGNEWIAATSKGIIKYEKESGLVLRLGREGGLNGRDVIQFLVKEDKIWVITTEQGPGIVDPEDNTIRLIKNPAQINIPSYKGAYISSNGNVWLTGFPNWGAYEIDLAKNSILKFSTREGLANNSVYSVQEYNGNIILNSGGKINMLTSPELSANKLWNVNTVLNSDKLQKSTNSFVSDAITREGEYLWGDNGLAVIQKIEADTSKGKPVITGIRVMDKDLHLFEKEIADVQDTGTTKTKINPASMGYTEKGVISWTQLSGSFGLPENLSLPYDQNVIQFGFSELSSGRLDSLKFAYIMEGVDKKWTTTNDLFSRTYLNLTPGDYIFKLSSQWRNGKWNEPAIFRFSVRPPWYQTWWAYLIYAALILSFLRVYIIFRSRKLLQKNKVLEQKVSQRTEELSQSYNNVEKLEEIGKKITSSLSVEKIIGTVYNNVNALMDASVFGIGIYNDALKRLEFPGTYERGKVLPLYVNDINDKNRLSTVCFNENKEIVMGNLGEQHQQFMQKMLAPISGDQPVSLIYMPLVVKEKKLGVITVQSFKENAYSDYHVYMLRNIAIYAAIALENARSYEELKETQAQLVQSEKMASLGELTAGIAHEIQNPLNFVNNFSEVNKELVGELKEEMDKPENERDKGLIAEILGDIANNSDKINQHGKRADAIVKGMLQHSRGTSGQKEFIDINALCDEYLRLSYHGLRAKDKAFNAKFETHFDENIGKISVVPQDIGRAILNLINNAFYAVNEKQKSRQSHESAEDRYSPTVTVSTQKWGNQVEIRVTDNGNGIPQKVIDKIFQPFFTTKPSGKGTGLGLSLSYDIIKVHNGSLNVQSIEGEGSTFTIHLPVM